MVRQSSFGETPRHFAGLLLGTTGDCALLLGGNIANSVAARCFRLSDVEGYRWPAGVDASPP